MRLGVNVVGLVPLESGTEELYLHNVLVRLRDTQAADIVLFTSPANHDYFDGWQREHIGHGGHSSLERAVKSVRPDVLFSSLESAPAPGAVPQVLYAMDLWSLDNGAPKRHWFGGSQQSHAKKAAHSAVAMVVPSKFVQQECLRLLDVAMDRVVVAPLGADHEVTKPADVSIAQKPFLLAVGEGHELDDVSHILDIMDRLPELEEHCLVIVGHAIGEGSRDWGPKVLRVERLPMSHLLGLYRDCDFYVYPALRSGTGVSVLQALGAGARVIAPRTGGIPEVAGSAPLYFDPNSMASLSSSMQRAIRETEAERATQAKFGRQTAHGFTWETCAWKTLSALRRAE
jgi:glycosyltransferase involved in cell wall biosynthesis